MSDNDNQTNDVEVLAPDLTIEVGGREITVREPSWLESMRIEPLVQPLVKEVQRRVDEGEDMVEVMMSIGPDYYETLMELIAICASVDSEWLAKLSDEDGHRLLLTFWRVNRHFFSRRLRLHRALAASSGASPGARSSRH